MPKYKEIQINIELTPEMLLGELLKNTMAVNTDCAIKEETKRDE